MRRQQGRSAGALLELSTSGSHILSPPGFPFRRHEQTILRIIKPTSLEHNLHIILQMSSPHCQIACDASKKSIFTQVHSFIEINNGIHINYTSFGTSKVFVSNIVAISIGIC